MTANNSQNIPEAPYICQPCSIQNCAVCNLTYLNQSGLWTVGNPFCLDCADGFYLSSSKTCSQCSANCLECTNSTYCLVCSTNYFAVLQPNASQSCQPCPASCLYCTSQGCLTCAAEYYHEPRTVVQVNAVYQCFPCTVMPGCFQCEYENWCTLCFS